MSIAIKDQLGRTVSLMRPAKRIVSVVPSQTELLFDLGLDDEVVGVTKFCIHPLEKTRGKMNVGGTKNLRLDAISQLSPDLIIANKEENTQADIQWLMDRFPVYVSDIENVPQALKMIEDVGELVGQKAKSAQLSSSIAARFQKIAKGDSSRSIYLIWKDPYMAVGTDNYIDDLMSVCGFENILSSANSRYPEISLAKMQELEPQLIFLSSEPFPFKDVHVEELSRSLPKTKVVLVDGEMFSWYGSRMKLAADYLQELVEVKLK